MKQLTLTCPICSEETLMVGEAFDSHIGVFPATCLDCGDDFIVKRTHSYIYAVYDLKYLGEQTCPQD